MSSEKFEFTKENIDTYLKELAKEYRKQVGKKMPAELVLVGGASVLVNYGFRDMTTDIDAYIAAASAMNDAILQVGERFDLPKGWINDDFKKTGSYSAKLQEYSEYYKTFSNVLTVRTISAEYLVAMKLKSGRSYKNDLSDVLGILAAHEVSGKLLTLEQIQTAVERLYGSWDALPETSRTFISEATKQGQFNERFSEIQTEEQSAKSSLIRFERDYPDVLNESNLNDILEQLRNRNQSQKKPSSK